MTTRRRLRLLVPPVVASAADVAMTLVGQGAAYWAGDYATVDEFNPLARLLLAHHPLAFVAAAVAWWAVLAVLMLRLNARLAVAGAFLVTFAHAVAAAGWMVRIQGVPGAAGAIVLLVGVERMVAWSWREAGISPKPAPS